MSEILRKVPKFNLLTMRPINKKFIYRVGKKRDQDYSVFFCYKKTRLLNNLLFLLLFYSKELSFCHKHKCSNSYICASGWFKPWRFQTLIIWSNRIHSFKYQRPPTLGWKEIGIGKSEFVAKTQFLYIAEKKYT